jgi:competence protein ComEC
VLPLMTLGGAWAILWRGRIRLAGGLPVALGLLVWTGTVRPAFLISGDGRLAGMLGPQGRAMSSSRGAGFAAESWLEDDGDLASQKTASARDGFTGPPEARSFDLQGWRGVMLTGKTAADNAEAACASHDIVILPAAAEPVLPRPSGCLILDRDVLDRSGAISLTVSDGKLHLTAARKTSRLWVGPKPVWPEIVLAEPQDLIARQ